MVLNEKELAKAIMSHEGRIELNDNLSSGVSKIKYPSEVVWKSVAAALVTSSFFWGGGSALMLGMMIGLPAVLTVCGGVGGVVFITLDAARTVTAFKLLIASQTMDVLSDLRDKYIMDDNVLTRQ